MAYEEDMGIFLCAIGATLAASVIIPYARPIGVLMTLLVSDPGEMKRCAADWHDKSPVDLPPISSSPFTSPTASTASWHPPMAGGNDIPALRQDLKQQMNEIAKNMEGQASKALQNAFTDFDNDLALFDARRKGVGDCVDSAAELYHAAALVCGGIGTILSLLATYVAVASATGVWAATAQGQAAGVTLRLGETLERVTTAMRGGTWKVTGIIALVSVALNQVYKGAPFVGNPMKGKVPKFEQALDYNAGQMTPRPPKVSTDLEEAGLSSMLPEW